jgi:hypothetical protein
MPTMHFKGRREPLQRVPLGHEGEAGAKVEVATSEAAKEALGSEETLLGGAGAGAGAEVDLRVRATPLVIWVEPDVQVGIRPLPKTKRSGSTWSIS